MLVVDAREAPPRLDLRSYWRLDYEPKLTASREDLRERLDYEVGEAVRLRLASDVPLGAFLSGGIDSSIVVALMARESTAPVKTFSIGFDDRGYDELVHARRVARLWETDHHEHVVDPDAVAILPLLARHYGEPFADSSSVPSYYLSRETRTAVTVALNGDGGDECFAGYDRHRAAAVAERLNRVGLGRAAAGLRVFPDSSSPKSRLRRVRRFAEAARLPFAERYGAWMSYFGAEDKRSLYDPSFANGGTTAASDERWLRLVDETEGLGPMDRAAAIDVGSYLPNDLLVKMDIAAMANSLECRSPFLDHQVLEFTARLPERFKRHGADSKVLLKETFGRLLPKENLARSKMGFGVPLARWFRGPLDEMVDDTLLASDSRSCDFLRRDALRRYSAEHRSGRADHSQRLWALLMLETWLREVVERDPQVAPT
ncbi:MAG: asparagine synthase C-terminal domain-containing protein [Actinomycetota bacterium]|nr:asparagine synthase C-terminal domain-containing protein [Actinomycetota bacterium]